MAGVSRSDVARLILRLGVGGVMVAHGSQKLFGWFGGGGLTGTAGYFEKVGFRPGKLHALAAGATETAGGVLLAAGLATPITGAATASTMAVAAVTHAPGGFFAMQGGYEYPAVLGLASAALGVAGGGKLSLDEVFGARFTNRPLVVVSVAGIAATTMVVLARRRAAIAADEPADPTPTS